MRYIRRMCLPLVAMLALLLHIDHGDAVLEQDMPRSLMRLMSKYEHVMMRSIDFLATREWVYGNESVKRVIDWISARVMGTVNGEVLTVEEAGRMIDAIADAGHTIAVGTCPCRRARNEISDEVPNNTDMVFGKWAETYMRNYPGLYHEVSREEATKLVEEFDRFGFIHQVYGYHARTGAAYVMCNCSPDVCIPLYARKTRGYEAFKKGRSVAVVDAASCLGVEECGACLARCQFDSRSAHGGKASVDASRCFGCGVCLVTCRGGASRLDRKPGAELVYTKNMVGD